MGVILAKTAGFCFGVNRAVELVEQAVRDGKRAVTEYKVIKVLNDGLSLCEFTLHTGRTHQIRCHLAFIGHFVIGDGKYGKEEINKVFKAKKQRLFAVKIVFNFEKGDYLEYLNKKEITLPKNPFDR